MAYRIDESKCLRCGLCVTQCPHRAIVVVEKTVEDDGLTLYRTMIDPEKCTACDGSVSYTH
ncbi:MAG: 4Fe-4S binding protein, partial [Dehalococcoidales bacterium]|nr:4Fe-4S binding protein [Dehalococcoidales bacterium]